MFLGAMPGLRIIKIWRIAGDSIVISDANAIYCLYRDTR
jgi:hypothetical protein